MNDDDDNDDVRDKAICKFQHTRSQFNRRQAMGDPKYCAFSRPIDDDDGGEIAIANDYSGKYM